MTGLRLVWNTDIRLHHEGHWVACGTLGGCQWDTPAGEFTVQTYGQVAFVVSGATHDAAKANLTAWARLNQARQALA